MLGGQTILQQYLPIHITHLDGFCKLLLLFTDLIEFHIIMLSSYVPPCSFVCALKPLINYCVMVTLSNHF